MSKAKVRKDSFWGDFANASLLSSPHRESVQPTKIEAETTEPEQRELDS